MHRSRRGVAFYVETILLILFLLFSLTVLVRILGAAKQFSLEARQLSCAVRIAQDAAEQAAVCDSPEDLAALLDAAETEDGVLTKLYDAQGMPVSGSAVAGGAQNAAGNGTQSAGTDGAQDSAAGNAEAAYSLLCRVDTAAQGPGVLLTAHFTVSNENGILYELETQKYLRG